MEIKVFGPGCLKCQATEKLVREAVAEAGVEAQVVKVSDFKDIMAAGVFSTPAVAVDGEVKCSGRAPSRSEILAWIR